MTLKYSLIPLHTSLSVPMFLMSSGFSSRYFLYLSVIPFVVRSSGFGNGTSCFCRVTKSQSSSKYLRRSCGITIFTSIFLTYDGSESLLFAARPLRFLLGGGPSSFFSSLESFFLVFFDILNGEKIQN